MRAKERRKSDISMTNLEIESEADMCNLARALAADAKAGDTLALSGPLGVGKTVFARAFIQSLCGEKDMNVPSPTFTLVQAYDTPAAPIYHFDLYRLTDPEEVLALDWDAARKDGICLIEWPEKAGRFLSKPYKHIHINMVDNNKRKLEIRDMI